MAARALRDAIRASFIHQRETAMRVIRYSKEWAALRDAGYVETSVRGDVAYMRKGA